jgi:hypothetical protein
MGMHSRSNAIEIAQGLMEKGLTAAEANVEVVRMIGVQLITAKMGRDTRAGLMAGVKAGKIGRLMKDGHKPEAFFHPNSKWKAMEARDRHEREIREAAAKVFASAREVNTKATP